MDLQQPAESAVEEIQAQEIRRHVAGLDASAQRINFIVKNAHDKRVTRAVLSAPAFLSNLSDAEIDIAKGQIAKAVAPEAAKSRDEAMRALADAEKGWRSTKRQIAECGGILLDANGGITE